MASLNCSVFSISAPSCNSITRRRSPPLIIVSSIPSSKVTHRKNHLRPKILKTLNPRPYPPQPESFEFEHLRVSESEVTNEYNGVVEEDLQVPESEATPQYNGEFEDFQVSESVSTAQVSSGNFSATDFFKYGAICMLGGFVFHSVFSFWFFFNYHNNNNSNLNDGDLELDDGTEKRNLSFDSYLKDGMEKRNLLFNSNHRDGNLEIGGREKGDLFLNGNGKTIPVNAAPASMVDKLEMERKIEQIKLMAREARRAEEMKKEQGEVEDPEPDDESPLSSSHRLGIEREIGARLSNLNDRINGDKDNSAAVQIINSIGSSVKYAGGVIKDANKNVNQGNEALMFKKKLKFKSPSTKSIKTPKGFPGTRDRRVSGAKKKGSAGRGAAQDYGSEARDDARKLYEDKQVNQQDAKMQESVSRPPLERKKIVDDKSNAILNHGKNLEEKMETPDMRTGAGVKTKNTNSGGVQEATFTKSAPEVIPGSMEENRDTGPIFEKDDVHSINGSSRHGLAEKTSAANRDKVKQANTNTDMWWLNLRYVLVILMQRDSNGGQKALYKLKFTSVEQDQSVDSYIVAFEDHGDANNFCVLLESFFEDLDDFSAYPVPMTIQELNEEIASHAKKVVVVKKRQLQLYAGQPFTDVEMSLRSLIEQDQKVP